MKKPIYLDNAATTPVDRRVAAKMMEFLHEDGIFANPSSTHSSGQMAKAAVDHARLQVATAINAESSEIIWTSGATESDNLALKGAAQLYQQKGKHIVTCKTEHPAVLDCCQQLEKKGFSVTYLSPEKNGLIDLTQFENALRDDTILVSIMHVNNEIGVIQDLAAMAKITAAREILLHVDAAQSMGKIALDVKQVPIDLISFSAHKAYGPKGVGALYVRKKPRVKLDAQIHGGGHEQGMRSGTLATHQIVGMGEAFALAHAEMVDEVIRVGELKKKMWNGLASLGNVFVNGDLQKSVPHILNVCFPGVTAKSLMQAIPEVAFSAGSACASGKSEDGSYVLRALGLSEQDARCSVRFSFGRFTTEEEIDVVVSKLRDVISKM